MALPLSLKIVLWILVLLAILFFLLRTKRKLIGLLFVIVAGFGLWKGIDLYNERNPDLLNVKADIKISVADLIHEYETNDSAANQKYLGKVVETDGNIKKIETDEKGYYTIILGDTATLSSIRCSMDTLHNEDAAHLKEGSSAVVRGNCTGFNKDEMGLGSDVILNRCAIIVKKDQ
ncbi:MAG TPA: hypothetical protein VI461_14055 [Chitinophagaceae bacterium]|nr:hypothetical protein [Chitinophagaceae bacterium]